MTISTVPADIARAAKIMLETISTMNGFNTAAGANVSIFKIDFDEEMDSFPAIDIGFSTETQSSAARDHQELLELRITGFIRIDIGDDVLDMLQQLDRDIKNAIKIEEFGNYSDIAKPSGAAMFPPEGGQRIGKVFLTYSIEYHDRYGV